MRSFSSLVIPSEFFSLSFFASPISGFSASLFFFAAAASAAKNSASSSKLMGFFDRPYLIMRSFVSFFLFDCSKRASLFTNCFFLAISFRSFCHD